MPQSPHYRKKTKQNKKKKLLKVSHNVASVTSSFITVRKYTVAFLLFEKGLLSCAGPGAESHRQDSQRGLQWSRLIYKIFRAIKQNKQKDTVFHMKNIKQKKHIQKIIQKQQLCNIIFSILSYGSRNPLTTCWELVVSHIIGQGEDQT